MPCAATVGIFDRGTFSSERLQAAYPASTRVSPRTRIREWTRLRLHLATPATMKRVIPLYTIRQSAGASRYPFQSQIARYYSARSLSIPASRPTDSESPGKPPARHPAERMESPPKLDISTIVRSGDSASYLGTNGASCIAIGSSPPSAVRIADDLRSACDQALGIQDSTWPPPR